MNNRCCLQISFLWIGVFLCLLSCSNPDRNIEGLQIAFISDVHLQNVADNPHLVRSMRAQLGSTRLFNENQYAFIAALDDVVQRGIKHVVLTGDLTDDGELVNLVSANRIFREYEEKHGLSFLVTPGNHDPIAPYGKEYWRKDYLSEDGTLVTLTSDSLVGRMFQTDQQLIIEPSMHCEGYEGMLNYLGDYGYFPKEEYFYWETPFCSYSYKDYSFSQALIESNQGLRSFMICDSLPPMPDVSYLVEPVEGLWLLAIDGNLYLPAGKRPDGKMKYKGAASTYDEVLEYKKFLLPWIKKVTDEAARLNKALITFSHYPMVEFNNGATPLIRSLLGERKLDSPRVPGEDISKAFADAGVRLHFAGHMHVNNTGQRKGNNGKGIVNVQIPSLAAYCPAYKIVTFLSRDKVDIQTVRLESVPGFKDIFPLYKKEYTFLKNEHPDRLWDEAILSSKDYMEFCKYHLKEVVRSRFIPSEFPAIAKDSLINTTGKDLLRYVLAYTGEEFPVDESFDDWTGFDMICDMFMLRNGGELAFKDIGDSRIDDYKTLLIRYSLINDPASGFMEFMVGFSQIFQQFLFDSFSDHCVVDLRQGEVYSPEK